MKTRKNTLRNLVSESTLALALVMVCLLLISTASLAQGLDDTSPSPPTDLSPSGDTPNPEDDDVLGGKIEVGVEYVQWYSPYANNIPSTRNSARGLYYGLDSRHWIRRAIYDNHYAWEEDFKRSSRGGTEWRYIDQWDMAMFAGHGTSSTWDSAFRKHLSGMVFGRGGRNHDDPYLVPGDAYRSWGNTDLEWLATHSCLVLSDRSRGYWAAAMNRLHLILGFRTVSYGSYTKPHGKWFATYINRNYKIYQAWFIAADISQPRWWRVKARVLAEHWPHFYDRRSHVYPDYAPDRWYYMKDHWVVWGRRPANLSPATVNYELPVYEVMPTPLTTGQIDHLAASFGMTETTTVLDDEQNLHFVSDSSGTKELTIDDNGMFYFVNQDRLWETSPGQLTHLGEQDARQIADDFLVNNGLMPADARFQEVISDTMTGLEIVTATVTSPEGDYIEVSETVTETVPTVIQVIYSRVISYSTPSGDIALPVEGPGATIKVYISDDGQIVGAMGGWRHVTQTASLDSTPIINESQAIALVQKLGPIVSLAEPLALADQITVTNTSVGYYELPMAETQSQLIPIYILDASYQVSNTVVMTAGLYLPAAPSLMNPLAEITSYAENTPPLLVNDVLTLTAADASQPLSALGYGDDLNFALGEAPYTYTWRLGSTGEVIGTGRSITHTVTFHDYANLGRDYDVPLPIILEVTDGAGHTSSSVRFFYFAETLPVYKIYLPLVTRR